MMELDGRRIFAGIFLGIFLLIGFTRGEDTLMQKGIKDPRGHPNLTPFEQWLSAYDCLQNTSSTCPTKYQLTPKGWVNVTNNDTRIYCKQCKDHTLNLLTCLEDVMRGRRYRFESGQEVGGISYTISQGCSTAQGFIGKALEWSNARTLQGSKTVTYISVLAAWLFITHITM